MTRKRKVKVHHLLMEGGGEPILTLCLQGGEQLRGRWHEDQGILALGRWKQEEGDLLVDGECAWVPCKGEPILLPVDALPDMESALGRLVKRHGLQGKEGATGAMDG